MNNSSRLIVLECDGVQFKDFLTAELPTGTLKTRDWKTRDQICRGWNACMEREMTNNKKFSLIDNPVV